MDVGWHPFIPREHAAYSKFVDPFVWQCWSQAFNGSSIFFSRLKSILYTCTMYQRLTQKFAAVLVRRTNYHGILSEKLLVGRINDALSISFSKIFCVFNSLPWYYMCHAYYLLYSYVHRCFSQLWKTIRHSGRVWRRTWRGQQVRRTKLSLAAASCSELIFMTRSHTCKVVVLCQ